MKSLAKSGNSDIFFIY